MLFKVKLILLSLMVDAVLPSVIALQQSGPRQPWQALAGPQNSLLLYGCISLLLFSLSPVVLYIYMYI